MDHRGDVDLTVRLDVVALGDGRRGVSKEHRSSIAAHAPGDHRRSGTSVPPQTDAAGVETGQPQEVPEGTPQYGLSGPPRRLAKSVRSPCAAVIVASRRRSTPAAKGGTGMPRTEAWVLGCSCRSVPAPLQCTTVPVTCATMPPEPSVMSRGRKATTSAGRIAVPSRTSMMSWTWPSLFGPGRPGSVRQLAAAVLIAATCWSVKAWGARFGLRSGEVPRPGCGRSRRDGARTRTSG